MKLCIQKTRLPTSKYFRHASYCLGSAAKRWDMGCATSKQNPGGSKKKRKHRNDKGKNWENPEGKTGKKTCIFWYDCLLCYTFLFKNSVSWHAPQVHWLNSPNCKHLRYVRIKLVMLPENLRCSQHISLQRQGALCNKNGSHLPQHFVTAWYMTSVIFQLLICKTSIMKLSNVSRSNPYLLLGNDIRKELILIGCLSAQDTSSLTSRPCRRFHTVPALPEWVLPGGWDHSLTGFTTKNDANK